MHHVSVAMVTAGHVRRNRAESAESSLFSSFTLTVCMERASIVNIIVMICTHRDNNQYNAFWAKNERARE